MSSSMTKVAGPAGAGTLVVTKPLVTSTLVVVKFVVTESITTLVARYDVVVTT
jgi:hypothetical protein